MFIELLQKAKNPDRILLTLYAILCSLNRRAELTRLVQWAHRKKLSGPLRAYENRLVDEERKILRYAVQFPDLMKWANYLHLLNTLINPLPRSLPKGSAAVYSSKFLTYSRKTYSMKNLRV